MKLFLRRLYLPAVILLAGFLCQNPPLTAETDRNTNGIPDSWEHQYTGSVTGMSATADSDTDTVNNLDEFLAGTDPINPLSMFTIQTSSFNRTNGTLLTWSNASARAYSITWSTNLVAQPFTNLVTNLVTNLTFISSQTWNTYTDATHMAETCIFYRIKSSWTGVLDIMTCLNCHDTNLGTHAASVVDFSRLSHHVTNTLTTNDCLICHDHSNHQNGLIVLRNAYSNSVMVTLTNSPLINATEAAKLTPFCLTCHGATAQTGTPFAVSGDVSHTINQTTWWTNNSAHNMTNGAINLSCFGDGTNIGCHASSHGSAKKNLLAPANVAATAPNYAEQEEGFCLNCHNGNRARKSMTGEFTKAYHHPIVNTDTNRSTIPARQVECDSCHNVHAAQLDTTSYTNIATLTRNQVRGPSWGAVGISVSYSNPTNFSVPITNYTFAGGSYMPVMPSVYTYQICFKCHAGWGWRGTNAPNGLSPNGTNTSPVATDCAQGFNPRNLSGHPVVTGLNNYSNSLAPRALTATALLPPWNMNMGTQTMDCSDCHNTDAAAPAAQGPHGSAQPFMLRTVFSNGVPTTATNWPNVLIPNYTNSWCANCHTRTGNNVHMQSSHFSYPCYNCHIVVPHGGKMSRLIGDNNGTMPARYAYNNDTNNMLVLSFKKGTNLSYTSNNCESVSSGCTGYHPPIAGGENW